MALNTPARIAPGRTNKASLQPCVTATSWTSLVCLVSGGEHTRGKCFTKSQHVAMQWRWRWLSRSGVAVSPTQSRKYHTLLSAGSGWQPGRTSSHCPMDQSQAQGVSGLYIARHHLLSPANHSLRPWNQLKRYLVSNGHQHLQTQSLLKPAASQRSHCLGLNLAAVGLAV